MNPTILGKNMNYSNGVYAPYTRYEFTGVNAGATPEFNLYKDDIVSEKKVNYAALATKGIFDCDNETEVGHVFFSKENMRRLHKAIKEEVTVRTNNNFSLDVEQDESSLLIAMRAIFLQYGRFLPYNIVRQVKRLNRQVVNNIVPDMVTLIKQSYGYEKEINKPLQPIPRPLNVNNRGRKTLPALSTYFTR